MDQTTLAQPALFDLLARSWQRPSPIAQALFDAAGTAVAFVGTDGSIALAPLTDPNGPDKRIRMELETGRTTIRPREVPIAPLTMAETLADRAMPMATSASAGFLLATEDGSIWRITPRGQTLRVARDGPKAPVAMAADPARGRLAIGTEDKVVLRHEADMSVIATLPGGCRANGLAFSPDGKMLAVAGDEAVSLWRTGQGPVPQIHPLHPAGPIAFSADSAWLAGPDAAGGLWLFNATDGRQGSIGGFRTAPRSACFSDKGAAVLAPGAFRLAAWSMANPPLDGATGGALKTGRSGLVVVTATAAHPRRDLAAAGFADGTVTVAQLGRPEEMVLRAAGGGAASVLAWAADGGHLAIGTEDGTAALVSFPSQIFK